MVSIRFPVSWGLLLSLLAVPVSGQLLLNGGFEDGDQDWEHWTPDRGAVSFVAENGSARIAVKPGVTTTACFHQNVGRLPGDHRFEASAVLDATGLTAGAAVLRVEFWKSGHSGPASTEASAELKQGEKRIVSVQFSPPAGTSSIKVACFAYKASGTLCIESVDLVDLTGPILRPTGGGVVVAGGAARASVQVVNGTANEFKGALTASLSAGEGDDRELLRCDVRVPAGATEEIDADLADLAVGEHTVVWALGEARMAQVWRVLPPLPDTFSKYGGWKGLRGRATGFFHTEKLEGRWWIIDPEGCVFFSTGVNGVAEVGTTSPKPGCSRYARSVEALYTDDSEWAALALARLRRWGFNTLGAWSRSSVTGTGVMPYAPVLDIGRRATTRRLTQPGEGHSPWSWFPDVFDPSFKEGAEREAARLAVNRDNPCVLGYFLDNEFSWGGLWEAAFLTEKDSLCRQELVRCVREFYKGDRDAFVAAFKKSGVDIRDFPDLLKAGKAPDGLGKLQESWQAVVADRYHKVRTEAVRKADPNHMIISQRFAGHVPDWANAPSGRYCDIVCMNFYNHGIPYGISQRLQDRFAELARETDKPMLIGEWAFKALDSGLPCTRGAATPVLTQVDRSIGYASFLATAAANPYLVGAHWFIHSDQPYEGRFDGENSNYGLVDLSDTPYPALTVAAGFINRLIPKIARQARFDRIPLEILDSGKFWVRMDAGPVAINPPDSAGARFVAIDREANALLAIGASSEVTPGQDMPVLRTPAGAEAMAVTLNSEGETQLACAGSGAVQVGDGALLWTGAGQGVARFRGNRAEFAFRAHVPGMRASSEVRPYLTMSPRLLPPKAGPVTVKLGVSNPGDRVVDGALKLELSEGWRVEGIPETLHVPPGGETAFDVVLHVPESPILYPSIVVREPFVDNLVLRVSGPLEMAVANKNGTWSVALVNRSKRVLQGTLTFPGQPDSEPLVLNPGVAVETHLTGEVRPDASGLLVGRFAETGGPVHEVACHLYDVGGSFDAQGGWTVREGTHWAADAGRNGGGMVMSRSTAGSTGCTSPPLAVRPGQSVVVRAAASWRDIVPGAGQTWYRGNAAVYFSAADGTYVRHSDLFMVDGTSDWTQLQRSFVVPAGATQLRVEARLINCTGTLAVDDVSVVDCPGALARQFLD